MYLGLKYGCAFYLRVKLFKAYTLRDTPTCLIFNNSTVPDLIVEAASQRISAGGGMQTTITYGKLMMQ
jgi:hypothetical protein